MRHFTFIITVTGIVCICAAMFYLIALPRNVSGIAAEGGVFDLTESQDSLFRLDGEWEFYYGRFLTPEDFAKGTAEDGGFIDVPSSWGQADYPVAGYATYRLTVLSDKTDLMMYVPQIINSSVVWVNGVKVFEAGKIGTSAEETVPATRNAFVGIRPENGSAEIVIQVANYNYMSPGITFHIDMGQSDALIRDVVTRRLGLAFVLGIFIAMGFYHAVVFLQRRKEWVYLAFVMVCLFASLRFFFGSNAFGDLLLPSGMGAAITVWLMVFLLGHIASVVLFVHTAFSIPFTGRLRRAVYIISFIGASLFLVPTAPALVAYLFLIPLIRVMIDAVRSKSLRENRYNMLFVFALGVYVLWYPINVLLVGNTMFSTGIIPNLFLILCQCVVLSVGYAETKRQETALKERNILLDSLNRNRTEFLRGMNHELRTPLHLIATGITYVDEQIQTGGDMEQARGILGIAEEETLRVGRMLDGLATMASMNAVVENRKRVSVTVLLNHSAEAFRVALGRQGVILRLELAENMPDIFAERDKFIEVMGNLLSNAADYTENGEILIKAEVIDSYINVSVTDTGAGIPVKLLSRVFERGVSGRNGTGYGLAMCKTIVEAHGGTMKAESPVIQAKADRPPHGTAITFTVPVYSGQEAGYDRE